MKLKTNIRGKYFILSYILCVEKKKFLPQGLSTTKKWEKQKK